MSELQTLVPVEQKVVEFYGDELQGVVVMTTPYQRTIFVPLRPLCQYLGITWPSQLNRINRDPVLSKVAKGVFITNTPGGQQSMVCLPLEYLNGWLFGISANRVKEDLRDRVIRYQEECYKVLAAAFQPPVLDPTPTAEQATLMQIREMGLAIAQMAEQQMALTTRLDKAAIIVGEHGRRLTSLEQQLAPRQAITDEQAADIAEKVKALAMQLTTQDSSKNHFQSIFAELYRRFRVSSYKVIRQSQYHLVVDFLDEWAGKVRDEG
jgi:hypothetical protein